MFYGSNKETSKENKESIEMYPQSESSPVAFLSTSNHQSHNFPQSTQPSTQSSSESSSVQCILQSTCSSPTYLSTTTKLSTYSSNYPSGHQTTQSSQTTLNQSTTITSQPSIHPNIATPPSTPPSQTSLSPLNLPRICHDVHTDTNDMAVSTDPDCLGPCEPGTSVVLEGIVWNESDNGILVVNVTWRGKTYVGTLMDSTRHDWAPPRFIEDDLTPPVSQNYHHYYSWTSCSSSSSSSSGGYFQKSRGEDTATGNSNETRKLRKCRKDAAAILSQQQHANTTVSHTAKSSLTCHKALRSFSFEKTHSHSKSGFYECPATNCLKKFRHLAGLRYHQSHAHSKQKRGRPETFTNLNEDRINLSKSLINESQTNKGKVYKGKEESVKNRSTPTKSTFNASNDVVKRIEVKCETEFNKIEQNKNNDSKLVNKTKGINSTRKNSPSFNHITYTNSNKISKTSNSNNTTKTNSLKSTNNITNQTNNPNSHVDQPTINKIPCSNVLESTAFQEVNTLKIHNSKSKEAHLTNNDSLINGNAIPNTKNKFHEKVNSASKTATSCASNGLFDTTNLECVYNVGRNNHDDDLKREELNTNNESKKTSNGIDKDNDVNNNKIEEKKKRKNAKNSNSQDNNLPSNAMKSFSSSQSSSHSSLSTLSTKTSFSGTNILSLHNNNRSNKSNLRNNDKAHDVVKAENNHISHSTPSNYGGNGDIQKDHSSKHQNEGFLKSETKENKEIDMAPHTREEKANTKMNSLFANQKDENDKKEIKKTVSSDNKNENTFNDTKSRNDIITTNTKCTTAIVSTTNMTNVVTTKSSNKFIKNNVNFNELKRVSPHVGVHEDVKVKRSTVTTTTFYNLSSTLVSATTTATTTTTLTATTTINCLEKSESNCNYIAPLNHFKTDYRAINPNKANKNHDDEGEEIKINKAGDESRSDVKSKILESYYENKIYNKMFSDNKSRLNDRSLSKDGRMEVENCKKTPSSVTPDSHKSNKEKEERVREKGKDGRKSAVNVAIKPFESGSSSRKHSYPSNDQTQNNKKAKMEELSPVASEAEAFYKSFQSIFGNPPLPLDLFMDPFYRMAMMSDPMIFHKNLMDAQTQMAKSLSTGGFNMPPSVMPFSFMNSLSNNEQIHSRTEDSKPVDMSSKKNNLQNSPKVDHLSSRSWPSYLLPPTSSSHFFGPLKDSGSDVTSRPVYDFYNDPNIFNQHKDLSQTKSSSPYNQSSSTNLLNMSNSSNLMNKFHHNNSSSNINDQASYYSNNYQNSLNNENFKRYDDYINNNNTNTFTYSSQTNKGRVREDSSKKMYSPSFPVPSSKRQDVLKNQLLQPNLLSQTFPSFDPTSQSQHLLPPTNSLSQYNYNNFPTSSSSNMYYQSNQQQKKNSNQQKSPQSRKLISPLKSKNHSGSDPSSKANSNLSNFYQKNPYYSNYNPHKSSTTKFDASALETLSYTIPSSSYASTTSFSSSSSKHLTSPSLCTKNENIYSIPSLLPFSQYPASSMPSTLLRASNDPSEMYRKK